MHCHTLNSNIVSRVKPLLATPSLVYGQLLMRRMVFGPPFVNRFALCYPSIVCLSCLSVTLVYCGQTVGRIKMKLGMQIGLGPGHIVLGGDPAEGAPPPSNFRPISVAAKWLHGSRCHLVWR